MKKSTKSALLLFALLVANLANSQTTVYADTVLGVSSEYSLTIVNCTNANSACKILGAPDVYPNCGDITNAWTFSNTLGSREWIQVGYSTQMYVDTIRIYETNHSGTIDTVYLRDVQTGLWNTIYSTTVNVVSGCNVLDIVIPTTTYKVDAVRLAIGDYTGFYWPEYDAVALIGSAVSTVGVDEYKLKNTTIFPNPSNGDITVNTDRTGTSTLSIYDVLGNKVFSKTLSQQSENLSLNLPSGIYFSVIEKNGKNEIEKLVLQ
ncbi:MAG: hypothetical protein A3F72_11705 [Bacteroidetes bacterium RIFCSPLOWO2_12_FULL_35_15]|nr:MAG: hypothetical protein A3F72_11705 [Bacteroidetes bacterium RIFCSPLOWO2_12_FULL_35_15]